MPDDDDDDDTIILCFGVGEVIRQDTITIPHYEDGIVTSAIKFPPGTPPAKRLRVKARIEAKMRQIQQIMAKATGGEPYDAP